MKKKYHSKSNKKENFKEERKVHQSLNYVNSKLKIRRKVVSNVHKYCISLWIASKSKVISVKNPEHGFISMDMINSNPKQIRSGTLTLVKTENRYFGITCDHVIKQVEKENEKKVCELIKAGYVDKNVLKDIPKLYSLMTTANRNIDLSKYDFFQPKAQYPECSPDIQIAELDSSIIELMGKKAIDLDIHDIVPEGLNFAIAAGYPEELKRRVKCEGGSYVAMSCCTVIAELSYTPDRRFTMHSTVKEKVDRNFSGMSGGPIFWNHGMCHNILGIFYESPNRNYDQFDENNIVASGELASPKVIKGWVKELFPLN